MIKNLYAKYQLADRLNKIAEAADVVVEQVQFGNGDRHYTYDVHLQLRHPGGHQDVLNEEAAVRLLDAMPSLRLQRSDGLIYLLGETRLGLRFRLYTGSGVCERVQVGTRVVPATPEQIIPAEPEHEVPVFELRCPDPLTDLAVFA